MDDLGLNRVVNIRNTKIMKPCMTLDSELWDAVYDVDVADVRRCLDRGDNVDCRGGDNDSTALMKAARIADPTLLLLLLHHGADLTTRDARDQTALHWAALDGSDDSARVLIALGADVNAADKQGFTPLMNAAANCRVSTLRLLVEAGADLRPRNIYNNKTALELIQGNGIYQDIVSVVTDPSILHWGNCNLTDDQLQTKLQSLPQDQKYKVLLLQGNNLTSLPDLTCYPQLMNLQVVNFANNRLTDVNEEHLPPSVKTVYLGHNNISIMSPQLVIDWLHSYFHLISNKISERRSILLYPNPLVADIQSKVDQGIYDIYGHIHQPPVDRLPDLSKNATVREVELPYQDIIVIDSSHFPASVEKVNLDHNKIQDIPDMTHIKCLRDISLSGNKLNHMPQFSNNIEYIYLNNNNIQDVSNMKHMKCLREISLSGNKLTSIPEFPDNMEHLDLSNNLLQSVKNMSNLKKLKFFHIGNNNIVVVFGLSSLLESLTIKGNPIHTLHKACFPSEKVYNLLSEALTPDQVDALQQPPPQIFKRGYKAVKDYYDQADISDLANHNKNRLAVVGEASAGKTSLIQTLIHGVPCPTGEEERTEVVQTHTWRLPDDCTYQVFDQGGHNIYRITNRFFLSKDSKNLICHKIKDGSIKVATEMLKNILHQFPNGHIHFGLTQLDLIKDDVLDEKVDNFKEEILKIFEQQITLLKNQTKEKVDVNLIKSYENRKKSIEFFPVSSQNDQGTAEVAAFFHRLAKENRQKVPQHWLDCLRSIQKDNKPLLKLSEYEEYYGKCVLSATEGSSSTSLRYFSDCGLVIWYEDHPKLKGLVFHNIQYLIRLMKCVFRHDLVKHLSYDTNADLKKLFNKTDYKKNIDEFQTQGLLSLKLLTYLWKDEFGAEVENKDEFLELMKCLDICQEVCDKNNEKKYFFPWFVTDEDEPLVVKEMCKTDNSHIMLNLQCVFTPDIPINVTELLIVHLQRLASENHYMGERKAWRNGLYVSDGDLEVSVLREAEKQSLHIYVKDEVEEIFPAWKNFLKLKESLLEILSHWYGIVERIHVPCFHCVYLNKPEPKLWSLADVFACGREKVYTDCSGDKKVPAALVTMINTGDDKSKERKHIEAVQEFLASKQQESSGGNIQPSRATDTTPSLNEPHSSQSEYLDLQNQERELDQTLRVKGTFVLRRLLQKQVLDTWGHELESLLQDTSAGTIHKSGPSRDIINRFQDLIYKNKQLSLFEEERQKLKAIDISKFDITLMSKILKVHKISGIDVTQKRWSDFQKGSIEDMLHPKKPGPPGSQEEDESIHAKLAGWVSVIIHLRNKVHNKTDNMNLNKDELETCRDYLSHALSELSKYLGISGQEMIKLDDTKLFYGDSYTDVVHHLAAVNKSLQQMTGIESAVGEQNNAPGSGNASQVQKPSAESTSGTSYETNTN